MGDRRLLAIVPARGGSKRLPRKNARQLGGKPLIVWSIETAIKTNIFCDVLLSTDSEELAMIGRAAGALVPWLRPNYLATDTATTLDVLHHALECYEAEYGLVHDIVLLQPTCPLRRANSVHKALQKYYSQQEGIEKATVVSVSPTSFPPEWCFRIDAESEALLPIMGWEELGKRSQDLRPSYKLNGSLYIAPSETIRGKRPLISLGSMAYIMDGPEEAIDIDTEDDWAKAENFLLNSTVKDLNG